MMDDSDDGVVAGRGVLGVLIHSHAANFKTVFTSYCFIAMR